MTSDTTQVLHPYPDLALNDTAVTPDFGRVYADAFAKARFELIADAAHMPVVEAPDATIAAIDAFLADS